MTGAGGGRWWFGRLRRRPGAVAALFVLVALCAASAGASLVAEWLGTDAATVDLFNRFAAPSPAHPLGTDALGRDVLVRLLMGGQVSLAVGLIAALAAAVIGTVIGGVAGSVGGRLDAILMRLTDVVIALPLLPLLIVLSAIDPAVFGIESLGVPPSVAAVGRLVVVIALVGWTTVARLVRAATLAARAQLYVLAAEALGATPVRIFAVHILPNIAVPIVVATTLTVGNIILLESVLSFLGLGIRPPVPSWGNMLTNAQQLIWTAPALAIYPGFLIFVTVIAFNLLGDGLQDALDPRRRLGIKRARTTKAAAASHPVRGSTVSTRDTQ